MLRRPRGQSGLTLTGLLLGLAVGSMVLSASLTAYLAISQGARDTLRSARLDQELRAALEVMRLDIQRAGYWDFGDTNADGDADADDRFTWMDLGVQRNGSGTFDTDADGDTDAQDLAPVNNPFQRRYGRVNNDLCVDTDAETGGCAAATCVVRHPSGLCQAEIQMGGCLTYSVDLDADARIGIRACDRADDDKTCPRPTAEAGGGPFAAHAGEPYAWRSWYPPDQATKTKSIEMEMLGFRHRGSGIEMRVGRNGQQDGLFGCNAGRWERITSDEIAVTRLRFRLLTQMQSASPDKTSADPCESGELCRLIRSVEIELSARVADDPDRVRSLTASVLVRNDRYLEKP